MLAAIETTGTIEQNGKIMVDETFSVNAPTSVRVIVLFPEAGDINQNEWMQAAAKNEAFDFLNDAAEDIYSIEDEKPLEQC